MGPAANEIKPVAKLRLRETGSRVDPCRAKTGPAQGAGRARPCLTPLIICAWGGEAAWPTRAWAAPGRPVPQPGGGSVVDRCKPTVRRAGAPAASPIRN